MPRRGRHRASLPVRLVAAFAALIMTGGIVVVAGTAAADDDGGGLLGALTSQSSRSDDSDDSDDSDSEDGSDSEDSDRSDDGSGDDSGDRDERREDLERVRNGGDSEGGDTDGDGEDEKHSEAKVADEDKEEEFPGRDKARPAGRDDYVDITEVDVNGGDIGEGGVFGGGSYSVDCGTGNHRNSDNYMAAPGKRNGAQHVHDYVGNVSTDAFTDHSSLEQAATSCTNGDRSTFFWPVLRDLGGVGPDENADGGGLDGNVGAILTPKTVDLRFHGNANQEVEPMPVGMMMLMGNAKAKVQDGDNANAKYTCTGFEDRVTDKYPVCPDGSDLVRYLDYPGCWDGRNLESKDFRSHVSFTDDQGRCDDDEVAIPQLRITLTYDQPAGRDFAIDSFPDNQHDPTTDHSDYENVGTREQMSAGADCINSGRRCDT